MNKSQVFWHQTVEAQPKKSRLRKWKKGAGLVLAGFGLALGLGFLAEAKDTAKHNVNIHNANFPNGYSVADTNRGVIEVITGSTDSTSAKTAEDLSKLLGDGINRRIMPVIGDGAFQNIVDLKQLRGIDIALLQEDVLEYGRQQDAAPGISDHMSYIAILYSEEFHLLVNENIHSIKDLDGKEVNFGPQGDGTAITGQKIFELLKINVKPVFLDQRTAIKHLQTGALAGMAYVGGEPVSLFNNNDIPKGAHFLSVPLNTTSTPYKTAKLTSTNYPALIRSGESIDTVAVPIVMVVTNYAAGSPRAQNVDKFVNEFFTRLAELKDVSFHPKWQEVNLSEELAGWKRLPSADAWVKRNVTKPAPATPAIATSDDEHLRQLFVAFLDEQRRKTGGPELTKQDKDSLFEKFKTWQKSLPK